MEKIHFIAIGGAAMNNLAIALKQTGYEITGSDDEIVEPSLSHLRAHGILPDKTGWFPEKITRNISAIILGMHARADNPELLRAKELGIQIYSYPEFLYEQTRNKKRVVIAGSHGKTTTTAMIIHVLTWHKWKIDFMVGSQIEGFENMVSLNRDSEIAIFEGDEYLSSPVDLRPKFIHYKPDITLISGIAWDHINVFPTFGEYVKQFKILTEVTADNGHLVYYSNDETLQQLTSSVKRSLALHPYAEHPHKIKGRSTFLLAGDREIPIKIFGKHNLQNINGAKEICAILGLPDDDFYEAISSFPGTSKRLQEICNVKDFCCYLDFAHAPSKVRATLQAVKEQFPDRHLTAVLELHTFSSLSKKFIPQYGGTLDLADEAVVYFDKHVLQHKKLENLSEQFVSDCFHKKELKIITNAESLANYFSGIGRNNRVLLLMSSGNFGGINIRELFKSDS